MPERIDSIDIFRGVAILQMILWQVFDFFAKTSIYTDPPYYIPYLNMTVHSIGLALFAFISGAGAYISVSKRLKRNLAKSKIIVHVIKRYGGYILLSLVFTTFIFGFEIFFTWGEAIQGIGLTALITGLILLFTRSKRSMVALGLLIVAAQPFVRQAIDNSKLNSLFPVMPDSLNALTSAGSLLLNASFRGFFSLSNLLPMALFGVVLAIFVMKYNKEAQRKFVILGLTISTAAVILHLTFNPIDYGNRSSSYQLLFIGFSFLIYVVIEQYKNVLRNIRLYNPLIVFGRAALIAYLLHFLLFKLLSVLKLDNSFGQVASYMLTAVAIVIIYYLCKLWITTSPTKYIFPNKNG